MIEQSRYPLITLSTRAQVEKKKAQTGTLSAARRIIEREGVIGLYAGLESALFGITVTNFVYYYCTLMSFGSTACQLRLSKGTSSLAPSSKGGPTRLSSLRLSLWPPAHSREVQQCY